MITSPRRGLALGIAALATVSLSACSGDDSSRSTSAAPAVKRAATTLVGPGCEDYTKANPSGGGSVAGMASAPMATAASRNPMLTTLSKALSGKLNPSVKLETLLNKGQFTVFAPTDEAFSELPPATQAKLATDPELLTKILTYHMVSGELAPNAVMGSHTTTEGAALKVTGSGNMLQVNGNNVLCGGFQATNGTVYLIDGVLMPK